MNRKPTSVADRANAEEMSLSRLEPCPQLKMAYKARGEQSGKTPEPSEEARHRAARAHALLDVWKTPPGTMVDGRIDDAALNTWIEEARRLAREVDRLEICDQQIGRLLSYAPTGTEGVWPQEAVREVVEKLASDHLDTGMAIGIYNSRGVVSRAPLDGGNLERDLAERYHRFATALADAWPRCARLARRVAEIYEREARSEDVRAELEKELW